ncbi:MAG: pyridoxamine-phosphate oxidase [Deltaproteobacteria bacterium]|nr:pyridoxamine-phosphate oxidase [Deltaproteobacteria bacterium]MBT6613519.1 pyridoxamine-phosphate oxidase [Deltaproteobacteria bacterium]MBT7151520.1 pyridoxamine-phosphate oxidase [Deltaproteobacteria bacterium]MBT7713631.1 pyridoxamine-phosphate oxidase [Deltaproteobacteria bacterium]
MLIRNLKGSRRSKRLQFDISGVTIYYEFHEGSHIESLRTVLGGKGVDLGKKMKNLNELDGVLTDTWSMLKRGVEKFNDPCHWPVLGTIGEDGCSQRTVILRRFDRIERLLVCYTDARATKVREIKENSRVSWLFYHPGKKIQVKIAGPAELHTDDPFAENLWQATSVATRMNFCTADPPGTQVEHPTTGLPDFFVNKAPTLLDGERGRKNFMVISCRIQSMDWLALGILGNKRAKFEWMENELSAFWLVP